MSDRELHAYLAAYDGEPAPVGFSDAQVEAAAEALYRWTVREMRWDMLYEGVRDVYREGARKALEAARNVGRTDQ